MTPPAAPANADGAPEEHRADEPVTLDDDQLARYGEVRTFLDEDALHDLLLRRGSAILDQPIPYLVRAVRNQQIDNWRKHRRDLSFDELSPNTSSTSAMWDPLVRVAQSDELSRVLDAIASMDDRDVLVLWAHEAGSSDEEIQAEWDRLQYKPANPSLEALRKRRERARAALRRLVEG
jgi:DNA-directed RNA polymerase specialized sigma24 family protein